MAADNEFIAKGEKEKAVKPGKEKDTGKKKSKVSPVDLIRKRFNEKKVKSTIGISLILLAFYLFVANFSYILTWEEDQNRVLSKGLFEFLFDGNEEPVANWFGKFGAWTSHLLIHKWFGLASFFIPFVMFVLGFKALFNITLFPIAKTLVASSLSLVWFSVFFGYFSSQISYFGGTFGFQINEWLALTFGRFGTIILISVLGYLFAMIMFNVTLYKVLAFLGLSRFKSKKEDEEHLSEVIDASDLNVVNTIKEDQIEEDDEAETIVFLNRDEELDEPEPDDEISLDFDEQEEDEMESEVIDNHDEENDGEFQFEVAEEKEEDKTVSEDEFESKRLEYGEYDPKLDLANYKLPPIDLLKDYGGNGGSVNKAELEENKNKIVQTLSNYKIEIAKIRATVGPTVTLYEIVPAPGVRISKIKNLEDDIALSLAALGIRIIAPIPGKGTIGIEVPNSKPDMVSMRSLIAAKKFQDSDAELPIVMGKTITNETFTFDLTKMPHLLVAGATGQGKSVGLNAILISLLYKKHPSQVKFVLVDPKKVELTLYNRASLPCKTSGRRRRNNYRR